MGDFAEDARDIEEEWEMTRALHKQGRCGPDCPFCDPDFEPLFTFQHR